MALSISSTGTNPLQSGGGDSRRAESLRRREGPEDAAEKARASAGAEAFAARREGDSSRVRASEDVREARLERIRGAEEPAANERTGAGAYLAVQRGTITDPGEGELVGIDIYV